VDEGGTYIKITRLIRYIIAFKLQLWIIFFHSRSNAGKTAGAYSECQFKNIEPGLSCK
jgi:hypothetical protein